MLSNEECRTIAEQYLLLLEQQSGEKFVLIPEPLETSATFAYFYNTAEFIATGDSIHALAGNGPLMVSRLTGEIRAAGTALPTKHYMLEFEAMNEKSGHGRQAAV